MAAVASLLAGTDETGTERARKALATAVNLGTASRPVLQIARQWLGRIALRADNLEAATRNLAGAERSAWTAWAAGRQAFRAGNYREAALQYRSAVEMWETAKRSEVRTLMERLAPQPDLPAARADLGGAQLLAGQLADAIQSLSKVTESRAVFLRARAKELAGQTEAALADYNLASRTAFAAAKDLASGEAHLYRGIIFFRRKDYARAETEFSSALNFEIPAAFRGDAAAWRHMAAVAVGSCEASRSSLERAMATVSPYFPKDEARTLTLTCPISTTGSRL
jgi:tetratricopeptide (TPR) repeat protein